MLNYFSHYKMTTCFIVFLFAFLITGCNKDSGPTGIGLQPSPFEGSWILIKFEGNSVTDSSIYTFRDTTFWAQIGKQVTPIQSFIYDANQNPKQIDFGYQGAYTTLGIYYFSNDTILTLKVMDGASTRATNFNVETGYDLLELVKQ